jgi:hypothetical protein
MDFGPAHDSGGLQAARQASRPVMVTPGSSATRAPRMERVHHLLARQIQRLDESALLGLANWWFGSIPIHFSIRRMSDEPEDFPPDEIRSPDEVARRALALFAVVGLTLRAERRAVLDWLLENDLWKELSPRELGFVDTPAPSRQQIIDVTWQSERLMMLLWALGLVAEMPAADEQCDTSLFQDVLPPYADKSVAEFLAGARMRPDDQLQAMQDTCLDLHWHARDAKIHGRAPRKNVNIEIIQERHYAINWVMGYDGGVPWDEVTTDT